MGVASLGLAFGGLGMEAGAKLAAGDVEAQALENQAFLRREQANELLRRSELNIELSRSEGEKFKSEQVAAFAKSGVDVSFGSAVQLQAVTAAAITQDLLNQREEARQEARNIILGAEAQESAAGSVRSAAKISAVSGFVSGGSSAASAGGFF